MTRRERVLVLCERILDAAPQFLRREVSHPMVASLMMFLPAIRQDVLRTVARMSDERLDELCRIVRSLADYLDSEDGREGGLRGPNGEREDHAGAVPAPEPVVRGLSRPQA
jgi:hypothetical protein